MSLLLFPTLHDANALEVQEGTTELMATNFAIDLRVYIGVRRVDWSTPEARMRWNLHAPPTYNLGNDWLTVSSTVASTVTTWPATIDIVSSTDWPTAGGFWIGPNAAGHIESGIYTGFSGNTITGITWPRRNVEATGSYAVGAAIRPFYDATSYLDGSINLSAGMQGSWWRWQASMNMHGIHNAVCARDNSIVVMRRKKVGSTWTGWRLWIYGYITNVTQSKEWTDYPLYSVQVEGVSQYLQHNTCNPISTTNRNLARNKTVQASSTLADPALDTDSDDWIGITPPSVATGNVVDGNRNTVWISNAEPNNITYEVGADVLVAKIDEIFPRPWTGKSDRLQWFRCYFPGSLRLDRFTILNEQSTYDEGEDDASGIYLNLANVPESLRNMESKWIIFCNNRTVFEQFFDAGDTTVIDWTTLQGQSRQFKLNHTDGWLWLRGVGWQNNHQDVVVWGAPNTPSYIDSKWTGAKLATPTAGHSYRRKPRRTDTNTAADWFDEVMVNPGERRGRPNLDGSDFTGEWLSVDLGAVGLSVGEIVTATSPATGGQLLITRSGVSTTDGLLDHGEIVCETEVIGYTGRTATHLTGISRQAPVAHALGTAILQYVAGVGQDAWPVTTVRVIRKPGLNPRIYNATVYTSTLDTTPTRPTTSPFIGDWNAETGLITQNTWPIATVQFNNEHADYVWARHVMVIFHDMASFVGTLKDAEGSTSASLRLTPGPWFSKLPSSGSGTIDDSRDDIFAYDGVENSTNTLLNVTGITDNHAVGARVMHIGGRAKVNELEVLRYLTEEDKVSLGGNTAPHLIKYILVNRYGLDERCVQIPPDDLSKLDDLNTSKGSYVQLIGEIAEKYGLIVVENPDSTITVMQDPWFPGGEDNVVFYTWAHDTAISVDLEAPVDKEISQVQVTIRDTTKTETETFIYPRYPFPNGEVRNVGERIAQFALGQMIAEREFWRLKYKYTHTITPVGLADSLWGPQRHYISWSGLTGNALTDRIEWTVGPTEYDCKIYARGFKF